MKTQPTQRGYAETLISRAEKQSVSHFHVAHAQMKFDLARKVEAYLQCLSHQHD